MGVCSITQDERRVVMQHRGLDERLMLTLAELNDRGAAVWPEGDIMHRQCTQAAADYRLTVEVRFRLGLGRLEKPPRWLS